MSEVSSGKGYSFNGCGFFAAQKRPHVEGGEQEVWPLLCLSPNAGCVFVVQQGSLHLYQLITPLLAMKGTAPPFSLPPSIFPYRL